MRFFTQRAEDTPTWIYIAQLQQPRILRLGQDSSDASQRVAISTRSTGKRHIRIIPGTWTSWLLYLSSWQIPANREPGHTHTHPYTRLHTQTHTHARAHTLRQTRTLVIVCVKDVDTRTSFVAVVPYKQTRTSVASGRASG